MTRRLTPTAAILVVLAFAPLAVAQDVPDLQRPPARDVAPLLARIGKLPGELVAAKKTDGEIVDGLFLAAVGRLPAEKEKERATKHIAAAAAGREAAARDLAWALVNTKEFLKLHDMDKDAAASLKLLNALTERWGKDEEGKDKK